MNRLLWSLLPVLILVAVCAVPASASVIDVVFYQLERPYLVQRTVAAQPGPELAVAQLMLGPTAEEAAAGLVSRIPADWTIRSAYTEGDYFIVNLAAPEGARYGDGQLDDILIQFQWTLHPFGLTPRLQVGDQPFSVLRYPQPVIGRRPATSEITSGPLPQGSLSGKKICIAAGHGYAWSGSSWQTQRPVYCAPLSQEDFHNVDHAIMLKAYLEAEGAIVIDTREMNQSRGNSPYSNLPWWQLGGPPYLYDKGYPASVYAPYTGVPPGTPGYAQVDEDRRSKTNCSNYDGADLYISLHTNGLAGDCYGGSCPTGLNSYYDSTKVGGNAAQSYNFANNCQDNCSAVVNSVFGPFTCRSSCNPLDSAFTECHYPTAPACLIEFGFHDSCDLDGKWLRDPLFTSAGMFGLYKGICQFLGVTASYNHYSAEFVSDDIPTTVLQGETRTVHITLRNRGVAWSESHQFRLGAVGDSDPFTATNRSAISGTVMPGFTYTFAINMTFSTLGDHVTDWRMVRDGASWFGETVTRTVSVLPSGDTTPPTVPQNLRMTGRTETSIAMAWNASTDNINVHGYRVYRDGVVIGTTTGTTYNDTGLGIDTTYNYQVEAYDFVPNYSGPSAVVPMTTLSNDITPPSVPQNLRVQTAGETSITFAWDASTDDRGVVGYRVYRDGSPLGTTANTYYTDSGLVANSAFSYQVQAYDAVPNESALSSPLIAMTAAGLFSDGFDGGIDNWVLEPVSANQPMVYSTTQNHGSLTGAGSAFASASTPKYMYHWLDSNAQSLTAGGYKSGAFGAWIYDTVSTTSLRTGLRIGAYDSGGTMRAMYWIGVTNGNPPNLPARFIGAVYNGSGWAYYDLGPRSAGWHYLKISVAPYTGSNDVSFFLDNVLRATVSQPPTAANATLRKMFIGFNYSVNQDHYWDDITFDSTRPAAPSAAIGSGTSPNAIRWSFTDNANNEIGVKLYDGAALKATREVQNASYIDESGLQANTVYSRSIRSYAGVLESDPVGASGCTLSIPPSASTVTCSRSTGTWYSTNPFPFTAVGGYGTGKVAYYQYVWDQSPTHVWDGSEFTWATLTSNRIATASSGGWYFHVRGFNQTDQPNGTLDLGPYFFDDTPPSQPVVTDEGAVTASTTTLSASWTASDSEAPVDGYSYAIGTTSGGNDVVDWTDITAAQLTRADLTLTPNSTYYFSVKARNAAGLWSSVGSSDGILVEVTPVSIAEARALDNGTPVALLAQRVSAAYAGFFYIQDTMQNVAGIRVQWAGAVNEGQLYDIFGSVETAAGERYILATGVTPIQP